MTKRKIDRLEVYVASVNALITGTVYKNGYLYEVIILFDGRVLEDNITYTDVADAIAYMRHQVRANANSF